MSASCVQCTVCIHVVTAAGKQAAVCMYNFITLVDNNYVTLPILCIVSHILYYTVAVYVKSMERKKMYYIALYAD